MEPFYVLYDGECAFCRRMTGRLGRLDLTRRMTLVDLHDRALVERLGLGRLPREGLMRDMHAVSGDRLWRGFEAYREMARRLPLLWPVWPLLWIWPISAMGRRVYRRVADARSFGKAFSQTATSCEGKKTKEPTERG